MRNHGRAYFHQVNVICLADVCIGVALCSSFTSTNRRSSKLWSNNSSEYLKFEITKVVCPVQSAVFPPAGELVILGPNPFSSRFRLLADFSLSGLYKSPHARTSPGPYKIECLSIILLNEVRTKATTSRHQRFKPLDQLS